MQSDHSITNIIEDTSNTHCCSQQRKQTHSRLMDTHPDTFHPTSIYSTNNSNILLRCRLHRGTSTSCMSHCVRNSRQNTMPGNCNPLTINPPDNSNIDFDLCIYHMGRHIYHMHPLSHSHSNIPNTKICIDPPQ